MSKRRWSGTRTSRCEIAIAEALSPNLALRDSASAFLDSVEAEDCTEIVIDFTRVDSITRSFAHEYLSRSRSSSKRITEKNLPDCVQKMFIAVEYSENKPRFEELKKVQIIEI